MSKKVITKDQLTAIGIDVHSKDWKINIRACDEEVFHATMPPNYQELLKIFTRLPGCAIRVAYEAGPHGFRLFDQLADDGYECLVVPPSTILTDKNKVKTDKRDARKLAMLLEKRLLKRVHVLSPERRGDRQLVRTRRQIVNHRKGCACQIKSLLLFHGIPCPFPASKRWTKGYLNWLDGLEFSSQPLGQSLKSLLDLYRYLTEQIKALNNKIKILASEETYKNAYERLQSVTGIGWLSAIELIVELQEFTRFETPQHLASFLGLTPSENSTGENQRKGGITHAGNRRLRSLLVEVAWIAVRDDPKWTTKYEKIKYRRGGQKAIVAVARSLIGVIWTLFQKQEFYHTAYAA